MKRKPKQKGLVRKIAERAAIAVLGFHLGTQAVSWGNDLYQAFFPSPERQAFQQEFGIPIRGWREDIEEHPSNLATLTKALYEEQADDSLPIQSVRVESDHYLRKSIPQQLAVWFTTGHNGYYMLQHIVVSTPVFEDVVSHEVKHGKGFRAMREHPQFREEWAALAKDEHGESLYLHPVEQAFSYLRVLHHLVDEKKENSEENERLGFVSDYARTNIHEDIAETGSEIDIDTMGISTTAFYNGNINPTVLAKLRVGENYGIIQKGTVAFLELEALYFTTFGERGSFNKKQAEDFLFASEAFLQQHPDSVYETTVRSHRGSIFKYYSISHPEKIREAIAEYERCLMVPFKDVVDYRVCLQHLEESYRRLENYALAGVYGAAGMLLDQRLQQNDPTLAKRGVNDFLAAKGISLF